MSEVDHNSPEAVALRKEFIHSLGNVKKITIVPETGQVLVEYHADDIREIRGFIPIRERAAFWTVFKFFIWGKDDDVH